MEPNSLTDIRLVGAELRERIVRIAAAQDNLIHRRQLLELGMTSQQISYWCATHRLTRIHSKVYSLGPVVASESGLWRAALLSAGPDAALCMWSAGAAYRFLPLHLRTNCVHILAERRHDIPGVISHRTSCLEKADTIVRNGLRITSLPRTLLDLARVTSVLELTNMIHQAKFHNPRLLHLGKLRQLAKSRGRAPGARRLLHALDIHEAGGVGVRSLLELRAIRMLEQHGIRPDKVNVRVALFGDRWKTLTRMASDPLDAVVFEVDLLFHGRRFVIEINGPGHDRPPCIYSDAERERLLRMQGFDVIWLTHRDIARAERTGELPEAVRTSRLVAKKAQ